MRLILTEYINSLKEDGELDKLIQDILRAYQIEIFSRPEKGRQYGVDIYAVGKDFEDGNKKKVFLITVKQGDLDRQNWNVHQNSVQQSVDEIRTVFVRSNLAPQHKKLPIKIVVAFNGMIKQSVQQNWRGYTESNPGFEYALWEIDFLVNNFQNKLLNEHGFSNEIRSLIRKTIIHLENPSYDLIDYTKLLEIIFTQFKEAKSKKAKLKLLKELHLIVAIIIKYCGEANNLKHAVKCSEKYILILWRELSSFDTDKDYIHAIIAGYHIILETYLDYYKKLGFIGHIKDGFSRSANDSLSYSYTLYEQIGILSMCGLSILQMHEIIYKIETIQDLAAELKRYVSEIADTIISTFNNNSIIYSPRADAQHIEICLAFVFLYKLDRKNDIKTLLRLYNQQIGEGKIFLNIFPEFSNHSRIIAELDVDIDKRMSHEYQASNLFTVLVEWTAILGDKSLYNMYKLLKDELLSEMDLLLWFPESNTEDLLYTGYATNESGYALSNIKLPDNFDEFVETIANEFSNNCKERDFGFMKQGIWTIGLIASRHYRTYIFPYYWRQFLENDITSK
jgi:hypothetical protein